MFIQSLRENVGGKAEKKVKSFAILLLPKLMVFVDHLKRVFLVLGLSVERELVGRFSIGDLIIAEPVVDLLHIAGSCLLQVVEVMKLAGLRIVHIDGDDLPISLPLVDESERAQDLHRADASTHSLCGSDFDHVQRIPVASSASFGMFHRRIFPSLRESSIVPRIAFVVLDVGHEAELAILDVLADGVELFSCGDFQLAVGSTRDLAHKVEQRLLFVGEQWEIVPRRDFLSILLKEEAIFEGSFLADWGGFHV